MPTQNSKKSPLIESENSPLYITFRETILTGVAVIIPLLVTLYILVVLLQFVARILNPLLGVFPYNSLLLLGLFVAAIVFALIILIGSIARSQNGERMIDYFDGMIGRIPGLGTIYVSFRRMSDVMVDDEADNFRDVKLVEYPTSGSYTIAFKTAQAPDSVLESAQQQEMNTLFLPMAPNPVMGGFVIYVAPDRVHDIDMSLEEAFRTIVTSGVASEETKSTGLTPEELQQLNNNNPVK
ncbi:DUF502 domain-containing protein [Haladaptatus sp. CMAA 1911]|uniref:DUF502 domain-containing protein n=1 Tax=unclassified Haladaptatus TaxID=2622732 RepID=UPI00375510D3